MVLNLARAVGLTDSDSWVEHHGQQSILATSRYDREVHGRIVRRVHQEDMCQALGMRTGDTYPELTRKMAAPIGNQVSLDKADRAALLAEAKAMGIPQRGAEHALDELTTNLRQAMASLDPSLLTGWDCERVLDTISQRLDRLDSGEPLGGPGLTRMSIV